MAAFEVIALDTATPQLRAPGVGDTYSVPRPMRFAPGSKTAPTVDMTFPAGVTMGFFPEGDYVISVTHNGKVSYKFANTTFRIYDSSENQQLAFQGQTATILFGTAEDLQITRAASDTLALRRGGNSQTLRVNGTHTDNSNGRWLQLSMTTAGVATITPTGNGSGASGNVLHISGLPTSNPGPGILWNNAGTPAIGT